MKTYQDLMDLGDNEAKRREFILSAIKEHKSSQLYKDAIVAEKYYDGENVTIARYEKLIYDLQGRAHVDLYTANHKIMDQFFGKAVQEKIQYLLGNGITFSKEHDDKLGKDFLQRVKQAATASSWGGVAYGFYNLDHISVFTVPEFVALADEETSAIKAGIRFWQLADDKPLRVTLYELDGYTEYIKQKDTDLEELHPKRDYIQIVTSSEVDGEQIVDGRNYPGFPIVPLKNTDKCKSDLSGKRNTLDALDLALSGMVNNVAEGNLIYWVLKNCGGMDDLDDAKFIDKVRTTHVAHADDDGGSAEPHTIEAPFEGTKETINVLKTQLIDDFQCFDYAAVSAGSNVATAIKAAYIPLDLKTDQFEDRITEFILEILSLAGINDKPSFTRNKLINALEETQQLMMCAQYLPDGYVTKKILTINGDIDQFDAVQEEKSGEDISRIDFGADE